MEGEAKIEVQYLKKKNKTDANSITSVFSTIEYCCVRLNIPD
jgi:hypothetical protein